MLRQKLTMTAVAAAVAVSSMGAVTASADEVNLYSYRQEFLIRPFLEQFEKESGHKVNVVYASSGILERLKAEGANSPADVVLTVDIARLKAIADEGLFQSVSTDTLKENIPAQYVGENNEWYGLTLRSRILYVSKDRVADGAIKTYEDLADPKWKGKICTRSGKHVYNRSLIASIIAAHGEAEAEKLRVAAAELRYAVDAAGQRALHEADNLLSQELIDMKVRLAVIEHLKDIVAESVKPVSAIDGIKIVQVDGLNGGNSAAGAAAAAGTAGGNGGNLADQVVASALKYRSQAPLIDSLMKEVGLNGSSLTGLTEGLATAEETDTPTG